MPVLAWFLLIVGFIIALPSMFVFPPIAVIGLGMMYGGYLLRRKAREVSMRRQQGRGLSD